MGVQRNHDEFPVTRLTKNLDWRIVVGMVIGFLALLQLRAWTDYSACSPNSRLTSKTFFGPVRLNTK
jgi:hypothetical protein